MPYLRRKTEGVFRYVYVAYPECKNYKCLVISNGNSPGHFYCRTNEAHGCPEIKETIKNKSK